MTASLAAACVPSTFSGLDFFGGRVLSVEAALVTNYTAFVPAELRWTAPSIVVDNATFCNVTVSYTHPGQDDHIVVETWLPVENPAWNGRLEAVGGGGWVAGRMFLSYGTMAGALGDGFATTTTDAGLGFSSDPADWALNSPGNLNWYNINNLAYVSLNDQAVISKSLIESFYGQGPEYSYWNGCSQGGRQGVALAQRYPDAYDGIAAGGPALYLTLTAPTMYWPQLVMSMLGSYPYGCEMDAISEAAIAACDGLDGLADGIVADPDGCLAAFDPFALVGTPVPNCRQAGGATVAIGTAAAAVVNATWHGMVTADGRPLWHGYGPGSDISDEGDGTFESAGIAATNCTSGTGCVGRPQDLTPPWFEQLLALGDPSFNLSQMTYGEFYALVQTGRQLYRSGLDTDDPDLSRFRDAGGKLVTWHGLWDALIPAKATEQYFNAVAAAVPDVHGFYRHFEVPGLGHCFGRRSGQPSGLFAQLRAWVENGTAPAHTPVNVTVLDGTVQQRILCPYPQTAVLGAAGCADPADESCWSCEAE